MKLGKKVFTQFNLLLDLYAQHFPRKIALKPQSSYHFSYPSEIHLTAINQTYQLIYVDKSQSAFILKHKEQILTINGPLEEQYLLALALERWLKKIAKSFFSVKCDIFAKKIGVSYQQLRIRGQKTRWGSCSSKGNINLNYKLLFVEPEQLDYVIFHELVHLLHFNHSVLFWSTLALYVESPQKVGKSMHHLRLNLPF